MNQYKDRKAAGHALSKELLRFAREAPLFLTIPCEATEIASVISEEFGVPFDVILTEKISYPGHSNWWIGAMSEDEKAYLVKNINYADPRILEVINFQRAELRRKRDFYRHGHVLPDCVNRTVVLIAEYQDEGMEIMAAAKLIKEKGANRIVLAVPVAPMELDFSVLKMTDEVVCPFRPGVFYNSQDWYEHHREVSDVEARNLITRSLGQSTTWST